MNDPHTLLIKSPKVACPWELELLLSTFRYQGSSLCHLNVTYDHFWHWPLHGARKVAVSIKAPPPQRASSFFRHSWKLSIYSLIEQISLNTSCSRHYDAVNIIINTAIFKIQYFFSSKFLQDFLQSSGESSSGKPHMKVTEAQSLYLKSCV